MAKKKASKKETKVESKVESGEQLDLIDVAPKNAKPIIAVAREYIKFRDSHMAVQKNEVEYKHRVIELVKEARLQPINGGVIKFEYDGLIISLAPKEMELKVKES